MLLNLNGKGLGAIFYPYQAEIVKKFLALKNHRVPARERKMNTRAIYNYLQEIGEDRPELKVSRSTVINFMKVIAEEGIVDYFEKPDKGGYQRVYIPRMSATEFERYVRNKVESTLQRMFPHS